MKCLVSSACLFSVFDTQCLAVKCRIYSIRHDTLTVGQGHRMNAQAAALPSLRWRSVPGPVRSYDTEASFRACPSFRLLLGFSKPGAMERRRSFKT